MKKSSLLLCIIIALLLTMPAFAQGGIELLGTFISPELGLRISHPEDWVVQAEGSMAILASDAAALGTDNPPAPVVVITVGTREMFGVAAEQTAAAALALVAEGTHNQGEIFGLEVAGYEAYSQDVSTLEPAQTGTVVAIGLDGGRICLIAATAPTDQWDGFLPTFRAMLASLEFTDAATAEAQPPQMAEGELWRIVRDYGVGSDQFASLGGIDVGVDGTVYVAGDIHGVWVISPSGKVQGNLKPDGLISPSDVAVGPDGNLYVADWGANAVFVMRPDGEMINQIGGVQGRGEGEFGETSPQSLTVLDDGRIFVTDNGTDEEGGTYARIQVFGPNGAWLAMWSLTEIDHVLGVMVSHGPDERIWVASFGGAAIARYHDDGTFLNNTFASSVVAGKPISDLAVAQDGNVYVTTWDEGIVVISPQGERLTTFEELFSDAGIFAQPSGIGIGPDGTVYVSDWDSERVQVAAFRTATAPTPTPMPSYTPTPIPTATSAAPTITLTPVPSMPLTIMLGWNTKADLDLVVQEPTGDLIIFESPVAPSGGTLDNSGGENACEPITVTLDGFAQSESVTWPEGSQPPGEYVIWAALQDACGVIVPTEFTLKATFGGEVLLEQAGTVGPEPATQEFRFSVP